MVQYFLTMSKVKIESLLKEAFAPTHLIVIDDSAKHIGHQGSKQGGHFSIEIAAAVFEGKKPVVAHRLVYDVLKPMKQTIHALAIKIRK